MQRGTAPAERFMGTIEDWEGRPIEVARSRGGVLATVDVFQNLLRGSVSPWPPPEIVQKLYQSRQALAFEDTDRDLATQRLGFYCDLQSLHSEDAITWSVFGPPAYNSPAARCDFVGDLLRLVDPNAKRPKTATISLWRRIPHPDTLVPGGPEIDFLIATEHAVVLGESKWGSPVSRDQGKDGKKDQITLRREFLARYGSTIFRSATQFIVLAVSRDGNVLNATMIGAQTPSVRVRELTWASVCQLTAHPFARELQAYLQWKQANSK